MNTPNHIRDLVPDPQNRRQHNPRNIGMIVDALQNVGAARSIVIDEDNQVLAGNGAVEAAAEAGITKVHVVEVDGSTLVAVKRRGLSDEQKRALALYDNRTAELAAWNPEQLREDQVAGLTLEPWFNDNERSRILGERDDPSQHWVGMPEFEQEDQESWKSIRVHFKNKTDLEAFSRLVNQTITEQTRSIWYPAAEIGRYADKEYRDESSIPDLHPDEGSS
jgi:hypothetical protein